MEALLVQASASNDPPKPNTNVIMPFKQLTEEVSFEAYFISSPKKKINWQIQRALGKINHRYSSSFTLKNQLPYTNITLPEHQ